MKKIEIIQPKASISSQDIRDFEQELDIQLPEDYKKFLLISNGGHPVLDCFHYMDKPYNRPSQGSVGWFFAINSAQDSSLRYYYLTSRDRMPSELFPISMDGCGNLICLCVKGENYGKVYFWDHELEVAEGEAPTYDNISFIANSFTDFINSLHEYEEEKPER